MTTTDRPDRTAESDPVSRDSQIWRELGWGDPTCMAAFMSVLRTQTMIVENAHAVLCELSLSITDYAALVFLGLSPDHRQPLGKVAERLLIGAGRCSYVINHLEEQGYVERQPHPTDRRTTLAVLTDEGMACVREAGERLDEISYGFGSIDRAVLADLVETLAVARAAAGDVEPPS